MVAWHFRLNVQKKCSLSNIVSPCIEIHHSIKLKEDYARDSKLSRNKKQRSEFRSKGFRYILLASRRLPFTTLSLSNFIAFSVSSLVETRSMALSFFERSGFYEIISCSVSYPQCFYYELSGIRTHIPCAISLHT